MDYKLSGLLSHYVLVLMLLEVQWRPVFPALAQASCEDDINKTELLTKLLGHEVNKLLDEYISVHGQFGPSLPDDVPSSTISGINIYLKLQDIYTKNELFSLHLSKVEEYQRELLDNPQSVERPLLQVKGRLTHLLGRIKTVLTHINPEIALPTTPAPAQLSHPHDYAKKVYGWGVIVTLKDWLTTVLQVLKAKEVCDRQTARAVLRK